MTQDRLCLVEVDIDPGDKRLLRWRFRCGSAHVLARSLRAGRDVVVVDVQLLGSGSELAGVHELVHERVAAWTPFLRFADRRS